MATGIQIGRIGLNDVDVSAPRAWDETADEFRIDLMVSCANATDMRVLAQQLRGYPNPDEPVIPIIMATSIDETPTAFYEVLRCSVQRGVSMECAFVLSASLDCRRISSGHVPVIEDYYAGALMSNAVTFTSTNERYNWAVPSTAFDRNGPTAGTWTTRTLANGGTLAFYYKTGVAAFSQSLVFSCEPADYYVGACLIEAKLAGDSDYHKVTGQHVENLPTSWRLSNEVVRMTKTAGSGTFDVEWWAGAAWETARTVTVAGHNAGELYDCYGFSILRNGPETIRVRTLWIPETITTGGRVIIDFTLRRGDRNVLAVLKCDTADRWSVKNSDAAAFSGITGGATKTANDSDGNRISNLTPHDVDKTLTAGAGGLLKVKSGADTTQFVFGVGCEIGGTGSSTPDTYLSETAGFFGYVAELQRVRGR